MKSVGNDATVHGKSEGTSWARDLICPAEGGTAPLDQLTNLSPAGAPWLVRYDLEGVDGAGWQQALASRPWSLWRYRELLPQADFAARIDLGEGGTPMRPLRHTAPPGLEVWIKEEGGNPTGSFKDRGLSLAVNRARELGVPGMQMASAGNAALALSAYGAAAGLPVRVAVPDDTPTVVIERCRFYGAEVLVAPGTLVEAASRLADFDDGYFMASTFREPYRVEGKKTMGLELVEQLDWQLPSWIVYPTGGGTGIVGMHKAFDELERLGLVSGPRPRFVVVQMAGCAPLVRAFAAGAAHATPWEDPETRAWGLRVPRSLADRLILTALRETNGEAVAVEEAALTPKRQALAAAEGRLFGPEGAACLLAVEELAARGVMKAGERVVVFQTGHPANYGLI